MHYTGCVHTVLFQICIMLVTLMNFKVSKWWIDWSVQKRKLIFAKLKESMCDRNMYSEKQHILNLLVRTVNDQFHKWEILEKPHN